MPRVVEVPGYGDVEFPDGMSDDAIAEAIKKNQPILSPPPPPAKSIKDSVLPIALGASPLGVLAAERQLPEGQRSSKVEKAFSGMNLFPPMLAASEAISVGSQLAKEGLKDPMGTLTGIGNTQEERKARAGRMLQSIAYPIPFTGPAMQSLIGHGMGGKEDVGSTVPLIKHIAAPVDKYVEPLSRALTFIANPFISQENREAPEQAVADLIRTTPTIAGIVADLIAYKKLSPAAVPKITKAIEETRGLSQSGPVMPEALDVAENVSKNAGAMKAFPKYAGAGREGIPASNINIGPTGRFANQDIGFKQLMDSFAANNADELLKAKGPFPGGVKPDTKLLEEAKSLTDEAILKWKPGQKVDDATQVALSNRAAVALRDWEAANARWKATPSPENEALALLARQQLFGFTYAASGNANMAGRALRAVKVAADEIAKTPEGQRLQLYSKLIELNGGEDITTAQLQALTKVNPGDYKTLLQALKRQRDPSVFDKVREAFLSSILSAPITHIGNISGNTVSTAIYPIERTLEGLMPGAVKPGEGFQFIKGMLQGAPSGLERGANEFSRPFLPETQRVRGALESLTKAEFRGPEQGAIGGRLGEIIRTPLRGLQAEDLFFKHIVSTGELRAQAYRIAKNEGLAGTKRETRIRELMNNPTPEMDLEATGRALYLTFNEKLHGAGKGIANLRETRYPSGHPKAGKLTPSAMFFSLVMPFVRTPYNLTKWTLQRTPGIGGFSALGAGSSKKTEIAARQLLGTGVAGTVAALVSQNMITGRGPSSKHERDALQQSGWRPYSFILPTPNGGKVYLPFNRVEPLGTLLGVMADMGEADNEEGMKKYINRATGAITGVVFNKPMLKGLSDMVDMIRNPAGAYRPYENWPSWLVPNFVAQVAKAIDPNVREPKNLAENITSRIPGLSQVVAPKLDAFSRPIKRELGLVGMMSPVYPSFQTKDKGLLELARLRISPPQVDNMTITYQGKKHTLGTADIRYYNSIVGKYYEPLVTGLLGRADYQFADDDTKKKMLDSAKSYAKDQARNSLMIRMKLIAQ